MTSPPDLAGGGGTIEGTVFGPNGEPEAAFTSTWDSFTTQCQPYSKTLDPADLGRTEPFVVTNSAGPL